MPLPSSADPLATGKSGQPAAPEAFQARLVGVLRNSRTLDLRRFEDRPPATLTAELVPRVSALLTTAVELLGEILEACEADRAAGELAALATDHQPLTDVVFPARLELRFKLLGLKKLDPTASSQAEIVRVCAEAMRRLNKGIAAVENALCEHAGLTPRLPAVTSLEASLAVRRACADLRAAVLSPEAPTRETLRERLETAGAVIARLVGRDVFRQMRHHDRAELRQLHQRVCAWLNETAADHGSGKRLWQDLVSFSNLLAAVNQRRELVAHDRRVVDRVWAALFASPVPPQEVSEQLLGLLGELYGRDEVIAKLIASDQRTRPQAWREPLSRLRARLGW